MLDQSRTEITQESEELTVDEPSTEIIDDDEELFVDESDLVEQTASSFKVTTPTAVRNGLPVNPMPSSGAKEKRVERLRYNSHLRTKSMPSPQI